MSTYITVSDPIKFGHPDPPWVTDGFRHHQHLKRPSSEDLHGKVHALFRAGGKIRIKGLDG
ncbi:hypothetical protein ACTVJH_15895, partial [Desulfoplanes sp. PS50]